MDKVSANAITSAKIAANAITSDKIVADAITTDKLAAKCVTATEIASNAITTDKLAASAVTAAKINVADLFSQNITATNLHVKGNSSFEGKILATTFEVNQKISSNRSLKIVSNETFSVDVVNTSNSSYTSGLEIADNYSTLGSYKVVNVMSSENVNIKAYNSIINVLKTSIRMDADTIYIKGPKGVYINDYIIEAPTIWTNCPTISGFVSYSSTSNPRVRRIGRIVSLQGILKNNSQITASNNETYMFTIPTGFRPSRTLNLVQQGSGTMRWLMCVNTDGRVSIARYSNTTANQNVPAGSWLNCFATWMLD